MIGASLVLIVGVIVSACTGGYDISRTGTKLISPVAHWLVPKEIRDTELSAVCNGNGKQDEEIDAAHWTWSSPEESAEQVKTPDGLSMKRIPSELEETKCC